MAHLRYYTAIVLDVGPSMTRNMERKSEAIDAISELLMTMMQNRKTDEILPIFVGTPQTNNPLYDPEDDPVQYAHVAVHSLAAEASSNPHSLQFGRPTLDFLQRLRKMKDAGPDPEFVGASPARDDSEWRGDILDGIILAVKALADIKKQKTRILVFTDADGSLREVRGKNPDALEGEIDRIARKVALIGAELKFVVVGDPVRIRELTNATYNANREAIVDRSRGGAGGSASASASSSASSRGSAGDHASVGSGHYAASQDTSLVGRLHSGLGGLGGFGGVLEDGESSVNGGNDDSSSVITRGTRDVLERKFSHMVLSLVAPSPALKQGAPLFPSSAASGSEASSASSASSTKGLVPGSAVPVPGAASTAQAPPSSLVGDTLRAFAGLVLKIKEEARASNTDSSGSVFANAAANASVLLARCALEEAATLRATQTLSSVTTFRGNLSIGGFASAIPSVTPLQDRLGPDGDEEYRGQGIHIPVYTFAATKRVKLPSASRMPKSVYVQWATADQRRAERAAAGDYDEDDEENRATVEQRMLQPPDADGEAAGAGGIFNDGEGDDDDNADDANAISAARGKKKASSSSSAAGKFLSAHTTYHRRVMQQQAEQASSSSSNQRAPDASLADAGGAALVDEEGLPLAVAGSMHGSLRSTQAQHHDSASSSRGDYSSLAQQGAEVPETSRQKAFMYGRDLVPVGSSSTQLPLFLKWQHDKGLDLLYFIEAQRAPREMAMGEVDIVLPWPNNPAASRAVSALARGMVRAKCVGLCRYIKRGGSVTNPSLALLVPSLNPRSPELAELHEEGLRLANRARSDSERNLPIPPSVSKGIEAVRRMQSLMAITPNSIAGGADVLFLIPYPWKDDIRPWSFPSLGPECRYPLTDALAEARAKKALEDAGQSGNEEGAGHEGGHRAKGKAKASSSSSSSASALPADRLAPSLDQLEAMDTLVDAMTVGEPQSDGSYYDDIWQPATMHHPVIARFNQTIRDRALAPPELAQAQVPLATLPPEMTAFLRPLPEMLLNREKELSHARGVLGEGIKKNPKAPGIEDFIAGGGGTGSYRAAAGGAGAGAGGRRRGGGGEGRRLYSELAEFERGEWISDVSRAAGLEVAASTSVASRANTANAGGAGASKRARGMLQDGEGEGDGNEDADARAVGKHKAKKPRLGDKQEHDTESASGIATATATSISTATPVEDFRLMLEAAIPHKAAASSSSSSSSSTTALQGKSLSLVTSAFKQMSAVVEDRLAQSSSPADLKKACLCLLALREAVLRHWRLLEGKGVLATEAGEGGAVQFFNGLLVRLRDKHWPQQHATAGKGGKATAASTSKAELTPFWAHMQKHKVSLLHDEEDAFTGDAPPVGIVSRDHAIAFLSGEDRNEDKGGKGAKAAPASLPPAPAKEEEAQASESEEEEEDEGPNDEFEGLI